LFRSENDILASRESLTLLLSRRGDFPLIDAESARTALASSAALKKAYRALFAAARP
jgi:hypothetical protein